LCNAMLSDRLKGQIFSSSRIFSRVAIRMLCWCSTSFCYISNAIRSFLSNTLRDCLSRGRCMMVKGISESLCHSMSWPNS